MWSRRSVLAALGSFVGLRATSLLGEEIDRGLVLGPPVASYGASEVDRGLVLGPPERPAEVIVTRSGLAPVPASRKVLLFTTSWCKGCKDFKRKEIPRLKELGWRFGDGPDDHVQLVTDDLSKEAFDLMKDQYGVRYIPALVLVEDGQVPIVRQWLPEAPVLPDRYDVMELYNRPPERPIPVLSAAPRVKTRNHWGYPRTFVPPEWHVQGGDNYEILVHHLGIEGAHPGLDVDWLKGLTYQELVSVHSDAHNKRLRAEFINKG